MSKQNTQFQDEIDESADVERMDSIDDVGFEAPTSRLARPPRKAMEPGVVRSLMIAAAVGIGIGMFLWAFKPMPRGADASPIPTPRKLQNAERVPASGSLFDLPEWDEAAYQRDKATGRKQ